MLESVSEQLGDDAVIVLGCSTGGLAVIRALGRRGVRVIAVSHDPDDIGLVSKHVSEVHICPHPRDLEKFRDFMVDRSTDWSGLLILECGDYYATALSKLKDELSRDYLMTTQPWEVLSTFVEKEKTYQLAKACGVPCPQTFYPETQGDLDELRAQIRFPCIVKPTRSHDFVARFHTKLFHAENFEDLSRDYNRCLDAGLPVVIQEIVPGDDSTYERVHIYMNSLGESSVEVYHKTLRLSPKTYGVMRVGSTVPPLEEAQKLAHQLLSHAGYRTGVACFQFKRHRDTQQLMLIEVNGRIPRSAEILMAAGVDLPWIIFQDICRDKRQKPLPYEEVTWIELWPDILNTLFKDGLRGFSILGFIRPYFAKNRAFAIFSLSDPRPFWKQTRMLPQIARRKSARSRAVLPSSSTGVLDGSVSTSGAENGAD